MGKNAPTYNPPAPVQGPSADQLFSQGTNFAKTNMPNAYGAREGALKDLQDPNAYYGSFQPTSMESALGNQYFQNIWPDMQKSIMNNLSLSGMSNSPVLADTLARNQGKLQFDVGSFLSNQGNQRATDSLNSRLGIDPMASMINPYVQTGMNQGNFNAQQQNQYQQALAQQQYQQEMQKYQQHQGMISTLGTLGGAGLGAMLGNPMMGASLGSNAASLFGGGPSQSDLGQMLALNQLMNMGKSVNPGSGGGGGMNDYMLSGALGGGGMMGAYGYGGR